MSRDEHGRPYFADVASNFHLYDVLHEDANLDRSTVARRWLLLEVNFYLRRYTHPVLQVVDDTGVHRIHVAPTTLLGAMWWQLARSIIGEASYRKCKICRSTIELSGGDYGSRADRVFWSPRCKSKAHRLKVAEAKAMRTGGASLARLRSDTGPRCKRGSPAGAEEVGRKQDWEFTMPREKRGRGEGGIYIRAYSMPNSTPRANSGTSVRNGQTSECVIFMDAPVRSRLS